MVLRRGSDMLRKNGETLTRSSWIANSACSSPTLNWATLRPYDPVFPDISGIHRRSYTSAASVNASFLRIVGRSRGFTMMAAECAMGAGLLTKQVEETGSEYRRHCHVLHYRSLAGKPLLLLLMVIDDAQGFEPCRHQVRPQQVKMLAALEHWRE
jgi:hypothetical protein